MGRKAVDPDVIQRHEFSARDHERDHHVAHARRELEAMAVEAEGAEHARSRIDREPTRLRRA
ncbi:hypothetical protein [Thalassococcus profundi]|uniref:hypothetical protein n=1 Tax=Thalassococcus profundi TaxID=2282382 RepID=UPI001314499F|nr:hypothetical protein [Thalassococcus profundi]